MNAARLLVFSLACLMPFSLAAEDWPAFRGPAGNGISTGTGFPIAWSRDHNIRWRVPLPGPDNGSPIVVDDKVFVLSSEDQGRQRSILCFDREDGSQLWKGTVAYDKVEETHKTNPHCPTTPVSDGKRVVVWHRSAGMHCYNLAGDTLWSRDLGEFHHVWGGGSSPVIYKNLVFQLCGPGERTFLIALDLETGKTVWESPVEPGGSASDSGKYIGTWSTPVLTDVAGHTQLICPYHTRVVAYNPLTGQELWSMTGLSGNQGDLCYTSPMLGKNHGVIMGGFGGPAFGLKLGGSGDTTSQNQLWIHNEKRNPQRIGSGVIIGDFLYMANADTPGSLQCLNILTGEQQWQEPRTSEGPHWGSLVLADGFLYVTGQNGITRVFKPNSASYEHVAENDLGEHSNSTPAFSRGEIFLRTWNALYCVSQAKTR